MGKRAGQPAAKAPTKRPRATGAADVSRRLANTVDKASGEWAKADQRAQEEEWKRDIADIVRELKRCPAKIKSCRRATISDFFLRSEKSDTMPQTYQFMYKVPQEVLKPVVLSLNPKLTEDVWRMLRKHDRNIMHKVFYNAALLDGNDPIVCHHKEQWKRMVLARAHSLGNPIADLTWDKTTASIGT